MSRRQYPDTRGEFGGAPLEPCECTACQEPAVSTARVAWSYMRGDDSTEPVCKRHRRMAEDNPGRFIAHMLTKEKHCGTSHD
jgi:hypothetical protein